MQQIDHCQVAEAQSMVLLMHSRFDAERLSSPVTGLLEDLMHRRRIFRRDQFGDGSSQQ